MSEFTAAQFRSLIDALALIENVVKSADVTIAEDEYPDKDRDDDERLRAYRQDQRKNIVAKRIKADHTAKVDQIIKNWNKQA